MSRRQADLAAAILKDQDVVSLSSFIGVDGTNITLNSGLMLINLQPVNDRSVSASDVIRRLQKETAEVA
jgi:multidrug efflux pump